MQNGDELTVDVALAQSGDHEALDRSLVAIQHRLFRFIRSIVIDESTAEEVTQDVLITICRKIRWLETPHAFSSWTFQIAWRLAVRTFSKEQRRQSRAAALDGLDVPVDVELSDPWLRNKIASAMKDLSPMARSVLHLHYLEEMTIQEVAANLGIPVGTAKSRLAYALGQLRQKLSKEEGP